MNRYYAFLTELFNIERIIYRIGDLFKPSVKLPPDSERAGVELSPEGMTISVETALNSRCTSDHDGNPRKFHWGMFDETKKLSDEQINEVVGLAEIPRFTNQRVEIQINRNILTFVIENHIAESTKKDMMVESGMQQQAVGLVCAALGVGMVIKNLGKDGSLVSENDYATVKIRLDAMKPAYDGSIWSDMAPAGRSPWLRGNLPDPVRNSKKPLITTLAGLKVKNEGSEILTEEIVSQLLWAARGRTPHLYKSRPWGLTIPTWGGAQDISTVYLISDNKLLKYINWEKNRPTHSLITLNRVRENLMSELGKSFSLNKNLIVISMNEHFNRALWEVGYQLLNILLQAGALDISYEAVLPDEKQRNILTNAGVHNPIATVAL